MVAASQERHPLALGFYNPTSDISFRVLALDTAAAIDYKFRQKRVGAAIALRKKVVPEGTTAYRLINAEGDWMPGLIVDRYAYYLALSETAGMERRREVLVKALSNETIPRSIYERSESRAAGEPGRPYRRCLRGAAARETIEIVEDGLTFKVDMITG